MPTSTPPGTSPGNRAATVVAVGAMIVLAVGAFVTLHARSTTQSDAEVTALLLRQTEEISSASQTGEAAVFERYFDPAIIFTSEEGTVAGKEDTVAQTKPHTGPGTRTAKVTDFTCRRAGDTAATSFVDELTQQVSGQTLIFRYRSTEAWRRNEQGEWRLLASETLTLPREPWAVPLDAATLDEYVGDYQGGPELAVKLVRQGNDLVTSTNGSPPLPLRAEVKDVFFVPEHPGTRKIFHRDASGHVTGYVSRNAGGDLALTKTS